MPHPSGLLASSPLLAAAACSGVGFFAAGDLRMRGSSSMIDYAVLMPSSTARSRRSLKTPQTDEVYSLILGEVMYP